MNKEELISKAVDEGMEWAEGEHEGKPCVYIHWPNPNDPDDKEVAVIELERLPGMEWDKLRKDIIRGRDVTHMTRIVGYFSQVKNWNKSKIGELRDRQAGNYSLGGVKKTNDDFQNE